MKFAQQCKETLKKYNQQINPGFSSYSSSSSSSSFSSCFSSFSFFILLLLLFFIFLLLLLIFVLLLLLRNWELMVGPWELREMFLPIHQCQLHQVAVDNRKASPWKKREMSQRQWARPRLSKPWTWEYPKKPLKLLLRKDSWLAMVCSCSSKKEVFSNHRALKCIKLIFIVLFSIRSMPGWWVIDRSSIAGERPSGSPDPTADGSPKQRTEVNLKYWLYDEVHCYYKSLP